MEFKVGDRVKWCGVSGVVIKDYKFKYKNAGSLLVEFDARSTQVSQTLVNKSRSFTMADIWRGIWSRLLLWSPRLDGLFHVSHIGENTNGERNQTDHDRD
jgi:hypothetical protein